MELILEKEIITNKTICWMLGISAFIILTALGAFVRIPLPFTPVPITLQTFFVLLSAAFLGGGLGAVTQISYILLGILGLPIFTGAGSGLFYLSGPTAGYLLGFVFASLFIGRTIEYSRGNLLFAFLILCIGDLILLSCGLAWLKLIFGCSFQKLLLIGFIPFLPGDILKAFLAGALYIKLRPRLNKIF